MKNFGIFLILILIPLSGFAQKAQIKVGYDYDFIDPRGVQKHHEYVLLAGNDISKFYNSQSQWLDSMRCTKDGEQWYVQVGLVMMGQLMNLSREERESVLNSSSLGHPVDLYVIRDKDKFNVWDQVYHEYRKYSEPCESRDWIIYEDSVKTILGYECVKAEGNYHGRYWSAWFSFDVPVNSGPWKLLGLPGLIFEAVDSTGQHHFRANGIESVAMVIAPVYEPYHYEATTRMEFLKLCRFRYDNIQGMSDLHFGGDGPKLSPEKIEYESGKDGYDFLETDYR